MTRWFRVALSVGLAAAMAPAAWAGVPNMSGTTGGYDEATPPPANRKGDASPAGGSNQPGGISNVDDYTYQPDQLNLHENSGTVRILRSNQKNLINDYVTEVIPFNNPNAINMVREARAVFRNATAKEGGRAEVIRDKATGKASLMVICPKFQLPFIRDAVKALDEAWIKENEDGFTRAYYCAKNRRIEEVDTLAQIWADGDGVSTIDTSNNAAMRIEEPYRTTVYVRACETFDVVPDQMVFEGAIYEVNVTDDLKLGLDYVAWKNGPGRSLFECIRGGTTTDQDITGASSIWDPLTGKRIIAASSDQNTKVKQRLCSYNYVMTSAYMDFLASKGTARCVTRPKIIARSNQQGIFQTKDQVLSFAVVPDSVTRTYYNAPASPAVTGDAGELGVDNRTVNYSIVGNTDPLTTGIILKVTPNIGSESTEVAVDATYRTIGGMSPQGIPMINTRSLQTRCRVRDGEPLVIGGLQRDETVDGYAGVPFLSSIPGLGLLFGGETHSVHKTMLVIVLVPRLVSGAAAQLATVEDVQTMKMAIGETRFEIPSNPWGFDQWLLDKDKKGLY